MTDSAPGFDRSPRDDDELLVRLKTDNTVEVWSRTGMPTEQFAALLRQIADGFEHGDATRIS